MTTIIFDKPIKLPRTHFRDVRDLYLTAQQSMIVEKNGKDHPSFVDKWFGKGSVIHDDGDLRIANINRKHVK